uniref:C2 domain-containing protein n=1 Tax=Eutreptiella gymnastica TaxID=73025 RepID=A0A7S1ITK5_9EUGL|mmetsp:Transcript_42135/g.75467  ORF Transcript_42135/g.75467 Transcript_42135/m.75467 type:complete len:480 (+) Transcript_42135:109-1548(+)
MSSQRFNTVHITVLETRALPNSAAYVTAHCGAQKSQLTTLKGGRVMTESGGSLLGVETAEAIWINLWDEGVTFDSVIGSCMLLMTMFDLQTRPYEGWLPMMTLEGEMVGRIAVQVFGDWTERVVIGVMRGAAGADSGMLGDLTGSPFVELNVRGEKKSTSEKKDIRNPIWEEHFKFLIGSRDKLRLTLRDDEGHTSGSADVLGIDILKRKGEAMWIPMIDGRHESAKILIQIEADQWAQGLPIRILQTKGMATADMGGTSDMYIVGKCGSQTFQTSVKQNTSDAVWDEEFMLEIKQYEALHLSVKDEDILWDDSLGEAFIPAAELLAHVGEQVWVDLTGTNGKHNGKLLLWIQPPPGSVYPDTLTRKRLVAYEGYDSVASPAPSIGYRSTASNYRSATSGHQAPIVISAEERYHGYRSGSAAPAITYNGSVTKTYGTGRGGTTVSSSPTRVTYVDGGRTYVDDASYDRGVSYVAASRYR